MAKSPLVSLYIPRAAGDINISASDVQVSEISFNRDMFHPSRSEIKLTFYVEDKDMQLWSGVKQTQKISEKIVKNCTVQELLFACRVKLAEQQTL